MKWPQHPAHPSEFSPTGHALHVNAATDRPKPQLVAEVKVLVAARLAWLRKAG